MLPAWCAEPEEAKYVPGYGAESVMLSGPRCLALQEGGVQLGAAGCSAGDYAEFHDTLRAWRSKRRLYTGYDASQYSVPELQWTQSAFMQPQVMVEDRYLYDPATRSYTVDRFVADVERRYGGIDAVLLWPIYPNLGIDDRNQLDMVRAMPGGVAGVRAMIADFHRHGIRVLFPMAMWDQGTRDPGEDWPVAIATLMAEVGADGINGDTQHGVPPAFLLTSERMGHPLAFQPEESFGDEAVAWNILSWWEEDPKTYAQFVPRVYRYKWLESRHMANVSDRLSRDHTDDLQVAFFNGIGWESWENVWGIWNGITPRDGEATRRVATLERALARYLTSPDWEPFHPMRQFGVFASRWPRDGSTLWTVVNRNEYTVDGPQLAVPRRAGERYFDLYHGTEISGVPAGGEQLLAFRLEAHGFGAILAVAGEPDASTVALVDTMRAMTVRPLSDFAHEWLPLPQRMVEVAATQPSSEPPPGMVDIPAGEFQFVVQGAEIEGDDSIGVDVAYPWEDSARRFHDHPLAIKRFFIDRFPVTNAAYQRFLDATAYHPADDANFLKDWRDGRYPPGRANRPVTWVSLEDARAYAAWAGKRLPHEWEWQYAAQGTDARRYPWGNDWRAEAVPVPERGRLLRGAADVAAHPAGASPFGVMDMVGNVWQLTDEFEDEHTRAAILRGGSYFQPQGSAWYFPEAYRNDQHGKLLLMAPSKDRAGTVGFRCVVDATPR